MLTLKMRETLFEAYAELFCGDKIEIAGGKVPSGGGITPTFFKSRIYGLALPKLTNWVATVVDSKSTETKAAVKSGFFSTGNPC
jgi:hypothetical protein